MFAGALVVVVLVGTPPAPGVPSLVDELTAARVMRALGGSDIVSFGWDFHLPGLDLHVVSPDPDKVDTERWKVTRARDCVVVHRLADDALAFIDGGGQVFASRRMCRSQR